MKVIVVSGARSNVGKSQLVRTLCVLLPGAVRIKIGHHVQKSGGDANYYRIGTSFPTITAVHKSALYLIIESNRILEEITPDCVIYLPADNPKPSADIAIKKADIIRGELITDSKISILAKRLELDKATIKKIAELSDSLLKI